MVKLKNLAYIYISLFSTIPGNLNNEAELLGEICGRDGIHDLVKANGTKLINQISWSIIEENQQNDMPAPKVVATTGLVTCTLVVTTGYKSNARKLGDALKLNNRAYQKVSKMKNEDVKTGSYESFTTKANVSSGQVYKDKCW